MKLLKKFIQVCKEFKQICSQDKSQIMNFFILQALMFLAMLISIFLGINEMLQDGSMNKIFVGEEARVRAYYRNLTTVFWIVGSFLASSFYAMYRIVEKHR